MTAQLRANSQHAAGTSTQHPVTGHSIYSRPASVAATADTSNRYSKKYRPYGIYCQQENYFSALYFLLQFCIERQSKGNREESYRGKAPKLCELSSRKRGELKDKACPLIPSGNSTRTKQHRRRLPAAWHHTTCN